MKMQNPKSENYGPEAHYGYNLSFSNYNVNLLDIKINKEKGEKKREEKLKIKVNDI